MHCSFCAKPAAQVQKIVAGPGVYICDECVAKCQEIFASEPCAEPVRLPEWASMSDEELLAHLPRIAKTATQVETGLRERVAELRERGIAWTRIGAALGMTRQSAWERFSSPRQQPRQARR